MSSFEGSPLSPQQERLWRLTQQDGGGLYRAQLAVALKGALDKGALRRALAGVVGRHEILRTLFFRPAQLDVPLQAVAQTYEPLWRETSAAAAAAGNARRDLLRDWLDEAWARAADGADAPALRADLLELSPSEHALALTLPALCADEASLAVIYEELVSLYDPASANALPADEPLQYADYAAWQSELLAEDDGDEEGSGRAYWRGQPPPGAAAARLPFERGAGTDGGVGEQGGVALPLGAAEAESVRGLARRYGASVRVALLACWQTFLWRLSGGESDIVVGCEFDGRNFGELEGAVGLFARYLPARAGFAGRLRFGEHLAGAQRAAQEATERQHYFVMDESARTTAQAGELPAFPFVFAFGERPGPRAAAGVNFSVIRQRANVERCRIGLFCQQAGDALDAELRYDPRLFNADDVRRLASGFQALVRRVAADPEAAVGSYSALGEDEQQRLLAEFSRAASPAPVAEKCFHEIFEEQAARAPEAVVLVYEGRGFSYAELNARANRLAHHLRGMGVGLESPVALLLDRSPEVIVAMLAALKAGGAFVPLDTGQPKERIALMLESARPAAVLAHPHLVELAGEVSAPLVLVDDDGSAWAGESAENPASGANPRNLMYALYTSGSSGAPKGVAVEHRQLCNYLTGVGERLRLPAGASYATVSTFAADLGHTAIMPALATGGTLHVISQERISDPEAAAAYFAEHPVDCLKIVPGHLAALLSCSHPARVLPRRRLVLGGEASRREWAAQLQGLNPDCRILNHYGPTETTVGVLTWELPAGAGAEADAAREATLPLGRPLPNTRVYILDADLLPTPVGVAGELHVGGDGVTRGYLNRPDLTAERFIPDPFGRQPGARLYKTGDLARFLPDGTVEFLGRIDRQVKLRGYRIEPGEIEAQLELHPGVREAAVVAHEDAPGEKRLVAYVVAEGPPPPFGELRRHLAERLPDYMIPSAFMTLAGLPRTPNGKVDRRALPAPTEDACAELFVAPRTPVEEVLCGVWAETLGVERVGVNNNFFELGGHSLLAMQLLSRLRSTFQMELPLRVLFEAPTVAELAVALVGFEARPGQVEKIAAIHRQLEGMTPEAVSEMLRQTRGAEAEAARAGAEAGAESGRASEVRGR
jgi:amino acid adenylation domain-containing protein